MSVEYKWIYTLDGDPIVGFRSLEKSYIEYAMVQSMEDHLKEMPDLINPTRYDSKLIAFDSQGICGITVNENEEEPAIEVENPDSESPFKKVIPNANWIELYMLCLYDEPRDGPIIGISTKEYKIKSSSKAVRNIIENALAGTK